MTKPTPKGLFFLSLGGEKKRRSNLKKSTRIEKALIAYLTKEKLAVMAISNELYFVPLKEKK